MAYKASKKRINLNRPICTDEANPNIHSFDDTNTNHQNNNGLVRRAGIIPVSMIADTLGPVLNNTFYVSDSGGIIQSYVNGLTNTITLNNKTIGSVSSYGVSHYNPIVGPDDIVLTTSGTYLTAKISGSTITLSEYSLSNILLNTRNITFTILNNITSSFTSISIIGNSSATYAQQQEFILRTGKVAYFLKESNPTSTILRYSNLTSYYITNSTIYIGASDSYAIFGTIDGKVLSVDRLGNYKYPDGTGLGIGPYNNGSVIGSGQISAMTTFNKWLIVSGNTGRTGSFDGTTWKNYDGSGFGSGIYDNQLVLGSGFTARNVNALATYGDTASLLVFGGDSGYVGSYSLTDGWHTSYSSGKGPWLGLNSFTTSKLVNVNKTIRTLTYYKLGTTRYLMCGSDSGVVTAFRGDSWFSNVSTGHGASFVVSNAGEAMSSTIRSATTYYGSYVVGGDSGYVASFDGANWKKSGGTGTGTGPYSNQNAVGVWNITYLNTSDSYLIAEGPGRMGTYANGTWSAYNGTAVEGLWNNAKVLGNNAITASTYYVYGSDSYYVVGGVNGLVGSFDIGKGFWKNFDGGSNGTSTGPYNNGTAFNGQTIIKILSYGTGAATKLVFLTQSYIASYDGTNWKNYNGSGSGTGPYVGSCVSLGMPANSFNDMCVYSTFLIINNNLVLAGSSTNSNIASWDGSNWRKVDGTGGGTGPYVTNTKADGLECNRNNLGSAPSYHSVRLAVYSTYLLVYAVTAYSFSGNYYYFNGMSSWDGSNWKYSDGTGTGTGPRFSSSLENQPLGLGSGTSVSTYPVQGTIASWNGFLIFTDTFNGNTRIASWDGANYKNSDGTGSGTGPYYTGTAILAGDYPITVITDYLPAATHYMIVGSNATTGIASWNGSNWKNVDGGGDGTGTSNNGSVINSSATSALTIFTVGAIKYLIVAGGYYVGNWNNTTWNNYNNIGTGGVSNPHKWNYKALDFGASTIVKIWGPNWIFSGGCNGIFNYNKLTATWEIVYNNKNVPSSFFNQVGNPIVTQYKSYLVYCIGKYVNSFDGLAWRFGDSSGSGTGPFNLGTATGTKNINVALQYNNWLVIAGDSGVMASYDGSNWKTWNGLQAGTGIYSGAGTTWINSAKINCATIYGNSLAFGCNGGYLASFTGNTATNYNATGTGNTILAGNGSIPIGATNITAMTNYSYETNNTLVIGGGNGTGTDAYLASWNGTSWTPYNATGTGVYALAMNAQITQDIKSLTQHGNYLVVGFSRGTIASFDPYPYISATTNLSTWVNPNGTVLNAGATSYAPYADSSITGADSIWQLISNGGYLYALSGNKGRLASWDGVSVTPFDGSKGNWKKYNGTGTGTGAYNNGLIQTGNVSLPSFFIFNNNIINTGTISPYNLINNNILFLHASGSNIVDLPQARLAPIFAYRFENGVYLYGVTNCLESNWYSLNINSEIDVVNARYAVIQYNGAKSRALVSGIPQTINNNLTAFGTYGYNDFSTFTNSVAYPNISIPSAIVYQNNIGMGAVDIVFRKGGDTRNYYNLYAPQFNSTQTTLVNTNQCNTNTPINAYGKLTNGYGLAPSVPFEFRTIWTNNSQTALSVALTGTTNDNLGVLITNYGEFDANFIPKTISNNRILYKYNNVFYIIDITLTPPNVIQEMYGNLYKINTISPLNLLDTGASQLVIDSCDYNGRVLFSSTAAPSAITHFFVALYQGLYSNSVDPGNKFIYINPFTSSNFTPIGITLPNTTQIPQNYEIDAFYDNIYISSVFSNGSNFVNPNLLVSSIAGTTGMSYSAAIVLNSGGGTTPVIPIAQGYIYKQKAVTTPIETIFLLQNYNSGQINGVVNLYAGYGVGNQLTGIFNNFLLYGQNYIFDGQYIWSVDIQNNVVQNKTRRAEAFDLQFIAQSPKLAFFISPFDNSLFVFSGDYQLNKVVLLNELLPITSGVFGDGENTLLMLNSGNLVWMRDSIFTENSLLPTQQNLQLFNTVKGIFILGNDGSNWYTWQYTFAPTSSSVIIPLDWKSGYFGQQGNEKSIVNSIAIYLHNPAKTVTTLTGNITTINTGAGGSYNELQQNFSRVIKPQDWSVNGQRVVRIQPTTQRSLGISVELFCSSYVIIKSVEFETVDDTLAIPEFGMSS